MTERNKFSPEQEKWLQALESGEWKQCRRKLDDGNGGHCCLGVALKVVPGIERDSDAPETLDSSTARDVLHLLDGAGEIQGERWGGNIAYLTTANDEGKTFAEIAAFIRANPPQVFTNFDVPEGN